jgi:hypothetical protein
MKKKMKKQINIYKKENFSGLPFIKGLIHFQEPYSNFKLMIHEEKLGIPEDDEVVYNYNSSGLRSDEFTKNHFGKHILFAGCSETEGLGNKLENIWAHQVYQKIINEEKCSGFFNVGIRAVSISAINRQILSYIMEYGKPDVLFVNYPDFYRSYKWNDIKKIWEQKIGLETMASYNLKDKFFLKEFKDAVINDSESFPIESNLPEEAMKQSAIANGKMMLHEYMSDERNSDFVINAIHNIMFMEQFCSIIGIQFLWGTWDQYASSTIRESNLFNNYVDIGNVKNIYKWAEESGYTTKDLSARDIGHSGIIYHTYWAEKFFNSYKENKK